MSAASKFYPFDRTNVFYNLQDWEAMLGKIVELNPEAADSISQVMFEIIATAQARGRVQETIDTVKLGLEWIFPYTRTHQLAFTLFLFDAEDGLRESGGLEALLAAALEKAYAKESEKATQSKSSMGVGEPGSIRKRAKPLRDKKSKKGKRGKKKINTV